jgi:hypothetical protein
MSQTVIEQLSESEQRVICVPAKGSPCPRCRNSAVTRTDAPDGTKAWFINSCECCCFSWRSTEDVTRVLEIAEGWVYRLRESEIAKLPTPVPVTPA